VRRWTQPHELWRQLDGAVIPVLRHVMKCDVDAQGVFRLYHFRLEKRLPIVAEPSRRMAVREQRVYRSRPRACFLICRLKGAQTPISADRLDGHHESAGASA